jgi:tRNA A-37 threonylcarbamoyl transferase component Bud32
LPPGTLLGGYKIGRILGEGGMGFVYEATHEVLNRRVAVKMLHPEFANQPQLVTRFLNEAKAVNLINHQHIVNVYDYGDSQDVGVYFVMEFLDGETLDDLLHKRRPMQLPLLLHVYGQIAKALAAAHAKQIVHRDLKPANVFVVPREDNPFFIKLLDFGIAQLRDAGAVHGLTVVGPVMGTPQYMSPEQVTGGIVDARSDVWAMGVMLYRAATGEAPFKGEEFADLAGKVLHHVPRPAGELVEMPASLSRLITRCLERRTEDRCPSIAELIAGLELVKQEAHLNDDAILDAVFADAEAVGTPSDNHPSDRMDSSLPRYMGVATDTSAVEEVRHSVVWACAVVALTAIVAGIFTVHSKYVSLGVAAIACAVVFLIVVVTFALRRTKGIGAIPATHADLQRRRPHARPTRSIVRRTRAHNRSPASAKTKHVILFLAANPNGTSRLALDKECADIEHELQLSPGRDDFEFHSKWAVSIDDAMRHLNVLQPTIIHFSGHGSTTDFVSSGPRSFTVVHRDVAIPDDAGILLQDEQCDVQYVRGSALAQMIVSATRSARVVVLNACFSDDLADSLTTVVDCVVGMKSTIGDEAARSFAVGFYRALGHRRSLGNAVAQAVAGLAAKQLRDDQVPVCRTRHGLEADAIILPMYGGHT